MKPNRNEEKELVQFTLRLPKKLNDFLQNKADKLNVPKHSFILLKLWELTK